MKKYTSCAALCLAVLWTCAPLAGCAENADMSEGPTPAAPPVAERRPHTSRHHGIEIRDPYHWLRDQSYPIVDDADVIAYLEAENRYFDAFMAPHKALTETLFEEIKARQKPDDESVPVKDGNYFYQWRFAPGAQYRTWTRWPVDEPGAVNLVDTCASAAFTGMLSRFTRVKTSRLDPLARSELTTRALYSGPPSGGAGSPEEFGDKHAPARREHARASAKRAARNASVLLAENLWSGWKISVIDS